MILPSIEVKVYEEYSLTVVEGLLDGRCFTKWSQKTRDGKLVWRRDVSTGMSPELDAAIHEQALINLVLDTIKQVGDK